jgi:undecaprenyl-diphosphatase
MMLWHLILLALIQGVTEFLPISSSGHLVLLPNLTGLDDQGQMIDVAVHVGTLGAVVLYFWPDVRLGLSGLPRLMTGRIDTPGARLAFLLVMATVPVILVGLVLHLMHRWVMLTIQIHYWVMYLKNTNHLFHFPCWLMTTINAENQ